MIEYNHVCKTFGRGGDTVNAVEDVSFKIKKGHLVAFLGPSGCGKTTLLRLTNRLIPLTRGNISIDNQDIMAWNGVKLRQSMGYAIQEVGLFPNKTVYDNIAIVPRLIKWDEKRIKERVNELLVMLRLDHDAVRDRYPAELSGGQQQRVGVARCLAADPDILLMDEPFGAIDPINREEIQNEFLAVQEKLKKTIAFVTHDIHEAIKMGDRIAIFQAGRLIQYDSPEVILTKPANQYISDFVGADRALKVLAIIKAGDAKKPVTENIIMADENTVEAFNKLKQDNLDSLVVLNEDKPVGYVVEDSLKGVDAQAGDVAETFPRIVSEEDSLRDVLSSMLLNKASYLPVVDEQGSISGTISYRDVRRCIRDMYAKNDEK
ncbi:MAG: ATP-binding cassette domain-containing protein [Deltaproteobacteria bacterium]|nr:ATP-binding cassette domain-containing protein [Deltaproteobacteria bacterium]